MGIFVLIACILMLVIFIALYNRLVRERNFVKNTFSQIDVQLTRRYDLIPNLVEVAKNYLEHERETLIKVTEARNSALSALKTKQLDQLASADRHLNAALTGLFGTIENYPDLKANQQMQSLHEELISTEERVAFARQAYNDSVTDYNNTREQFPANLVASLFGFQESALLEIEDLNKRQTVRVQF
ncbi:MAG: LemA family protein [Cardiobacteriaceae bacterium]|nr:LemA family protein [Cardiobacteriaceae bacterium]